LIKQNTIEIVKVNEGKKADELTDKIRDLINQNLNVLSFYELLGVLDNLKQEVYDSFSEELD